ncbi:hypothetical protein NE236_36845 [Actinoallomurus purpureus]|uniref:hypothetical protein n=1 Tax=Actinoallomurus purpureus TaxID=478114 RepID=UPI00209204C6|nr:hypothetical protein [Actinoallomurus purpureus]MCO6010541.1 hypothetical protein [Actinoallomurus purpureus]
MTTLADRLIITGRQLEVLEEVTRTDAKPDDLEALAEHLRGLGEHGRTIQMVIDRIIENVGPEYNDVQFRLGHAGSLFEAAQTFSGDARVLLGKMNADPS